MKPNDCEIYLPWHRAYLLSQCISETVLCSSLVNLKLKRGYFYPFLYIQTFLIYNFLNFARFSSLLTCKSILSLAEIRLIMRQIKDNNSYLRITFKYKVKEQRILHRYSCNKVGVISRCNNKVLSFCK